MKKIVSVVLFTFLLVSCVGVKERKKVYSFAPFVSPSSIIESVGQNTSYLKRIVSMVETKNLVQISDYSASDYFLFFSFTLSQVDFGDYSLTREYNYITKRTQWLQPSGKKKSLLTLTLSFYDASDLTLDGVYTLIKEVSSSVGVNEKEVGLQIETIIETHLPTLLKDIDDEGALIVVQKLIDSVFNLKIKHEYSTVHKHVTISVGVAKYIDGITEQALLKKADDELYHAKSKGKNCYQYQ